MILAKKIIVSSFIFLIINICYLLPHKREAILYLLMKGLLIIELDMEILSNKELIDDAAESP
jgi:uncharacterized protein YhhL (DUF1145 family)